MGQFLSVARALAKEVAKSDNDIEIEKTTNDALNSLVDLAKLQTDLFELKVR